MCCSLTQAASFSAKIDRYELQPGESLLLTLELDQPDYFVDPDISPLQQDFELLSSQHQPLVEENGQHYSRWFLRLQPRREGNLTIPALRLGELLSAPLRIRVKARDTSQSASLEPVYIDSSLDREQLYVQAQAVLTVKIYHSVPLYSDGQLSPLNIDGARVLSLGEPASYQQYIQGIRHGVIEMRYAIFPQAAGILTIPSQAFTATLAGDNAYSLEDPLLSAPGRKIQVKSAQIPLRVNPPPADFPEDAFWLPAKKLQLRQTVSAPGEPSQDQAIAHSISLEVDGLPAGALPSLLPQTLPGLRLYQNPPEQAQKKTATGLQVRQQEQQLLVALRPGSFKLPALQLPWWNTETDSLEWASTEQHSLQVSGSAAETPPNTAARQTSALLPWQLLSLFLASLSLLLAFLWRRARKLPAVAPGTAVRKTSHLQEALRQACLQHQPQRARSLLDQWLRQHGFNLAGLAHSHPELHAAMRELNQVLYSPETVIWDGSRLWQALDHWIRQQQRKDNEQLPPLYPT